MVRIKHRYLLLNILYPTTIGSSIYTSARSSEPSSLSFQTPTPDYIDARLFSAHLRNHITLLFGDFGLGVSLSSLKIVYLSTATSTIILRVPRDHHRLVWAALTNITELPGPKRGESGAQCVVRVVRVSGTIRKAEEELIRRAKRDIVRAKVAQDGKELPWIAGVADRNTKSRPKEPVDISMQSTEDLSDGEIEDESD